MKGDGNIMSKYVMTRISRGGTGVRVSMYEGGVRVTFQYVVI